MTRLLPPSNRQLVALAELAAHQGEEPFTKKASSCRTLIARGWAREERNPPIIGFRITPAGERALEDLADEVKAAQIALEGKR